MYSPKLLLVGALLSAQALAEPAARIAFTSTPGVAIAGSSYNVTWSGGDGSPVTLTLRQGTPSDLSTVQIVGDLISGYYYVWTVSKSLQTASNYALQITQGQDDINYSGLFSIVGGTGTSSISYSGISTATSMSNSSTTARATSAAVTGGSMAGNSTALPRNTTFSTATPKTTSSASTIPGIPSGIGGASTSAESASASAAPTASPSAAQTTAPNSGGAMQLGSSVALVMGLFAAVMCLS